MDWAKRFLIVSLVVFFAAVVYSIVSFYQLRQLPEPEVIEEPDVPLQKNPYVLKPSKVPENSSASDSETSNGEFALTEEEWEEDSEDFDVSSADAFTSTPEPLVDEDQENSKYPKVPDNYPFNTPIWLRSETEQAHIPPEHFEEQILLDMVMVKLWSEGNHSFTAAVIENGTFYPIYPDVAYVAWEQYEAPDGTIHRYVSEVLTTSDNDSDKIMDQLNNGETPAGIKIVDYQSAGIDPHELLSK